MRVLCPRGVRAPPRLRCLEYWLLGFSPCLINLLVSYVTSLDVNYDSAFSEGNFHPLSLVLINECSQSLLTPSSRTPVS